MVELGEYVGVMGLGTCECGANSGMRARDPTLSHQRSKKRQFPMIDRHRHGKQSPLRTYCNDE